MVYDDQVEDPTYDTRDDTGAPPKKVPRRASPPAPPISGEQPVTAWVPPPGWSIKRGFLWCPKAARGFARRALSLHVRGCTGCPLKMERTALPDVQTWAAPNADEAVTCTCDAMVSRSAKYGLKKSVQRHLKKAKAHRGSNIPNETQLVLNRAFATVSTSKRTAQATGLPRVVPSGPIDGASEACAPSRSPARCDPPREGGLAHSEAAGGAADHERGAESGAPTSRSSPTARRDPPREGGLADLAAAGGAAKGADSGAPTSRYQTHAERVLATSVSRIGRYSTHMTVDIMSDKMPETTRRAYRYNLRHLLLRAGLLTRDQGLEAFDFRYLLGSPSNVDRVRRVLETVFQRNPATAHIMLNAAKHVLSIIPRRVFLLGDDLAVEWSSLVTIVTETLRGEEISARSDNRARRVEKAAKRQSELEADIGTERRLAARLAAHEWMRDTLRSVREGEGDIVAVVATYRQVLYISAGLLHGQRTQVYAEPTVEEFANARSRPDGSLAAVRMAGKEGAKYGPATAIFKPPEAEFARFYLSHLRGHLPGATTSKALFPGLLAYPSQQAEAVSEVFGEPVRFLMGGQLRRWHTTVVEKLHREGKISSQARQDLCTFRRHAPKTAQVHYDLVSRQERDVLASEEFCRVVSATAEPRGEGAQGSPNPSTLEAVEMSTEEVDMEDALTAPQELRVNLRRCDEQARASPPPEPEATRPTHQPSRSYAEYLSLRRSSWAAREAKRKGGPRRWSPEEMAVIDVLLAANTTPRRADVERALERFEIDWATISSRTILALVLKLEASQPL